MPRSPRAVFAVAFLCTSLAGYAAFYLFFISGYRYKPQDLDIVHGEVAQVREIKRMRGTDSIEIWLRDDSLPYRGNIGYPAYYRKDVIASLKPGNQVAVGILRAERGKPRHNRISGSEWVEIYSLSVEGTTAFALDDYNRWMAQNEKIGKIVTPIVFALGIGLLFHASRLMRRGSNVD